MDDQLHLSDEQFTEILLGSDSASLHAHLAACPQCTAEAARVFSAIGNFKQQSKLWAERRAATQSPVAAAHHREPLWAGRSPAWTAVALVLLLAVGIGLGIHNDRKLAASSEVARSQSAATVSRSTIKADNDLLSAIDGELRVDESTSVGNYALSGRARTDRTKVSGRAASE